MQRGQIRLQRDRRLAAASRGVRSSENLKRAAQTSVGERQAGIDANGIRVSGERVCGASQVQ